MIESVETTMDLFHTLRSLYHAKGFYSSHSKEYWKFPYNLKYFLFVIPPALVSASTGAYFILNATSTMEYAESFFMCVTEGNGVAIFFIGRWKFDKILALIDHFNDFIVKSKL